MKTVFKLDNQLIIDIYPKGRETDYDERRNGQHDEAGATNARAYAKKSRGVS